MKRNTLTLLGILVVLAIAAYLVLQKPGEVSTEGSSGRPMASYDSAAVDKMEITMPEGKTVLVKEAGKWNVAEPIKYPADEMPVTTAVGKGKDIELNRLVSTNPEKQHLFQVDSTGTLVRIYDKGTQLAAFNVGKMSSSFTETYVRMEGSNEVYAADGMLTTVFGRKPNDWRDKTIFRKDQNEIGNVRFSYGDTTFTLAFQDSAWHLGKDSVSSAVMRSFLGAVANFLSDEFIDTGIASLPRLTTMIEVDGVQIRFHFDKDQNKYYIQTSQSPQWFSIQSWRANQILKRKKDFLPAVSRDFP